MEMNSVEKPSFSDKFGDEKEVIFDRLLDMSPNEVQDQCQRYELPVVDKQI